MKINLQIIREMEQRLRKDKSIDGGDFMRLFAQYYNPDDFRTIYLTIEYESHLLPYDGNVMAFTDYKFPWISVQALLLDPILSPYMRYLETETDIVLAYNAFVKGYSKFYKEYGLENATEIPAQLRGSVRRAMLFAEECIEIFNDVEDWLRTTYFPQWKYNLYDPSDVSYREKNFLVSFAEDMRRESVDYPIVCCSVVNERLRDTYKKRKWGYLYNPRKVEIIGMWSTDYGTAAYSGNGPAECAAVAGYRFLTELQWLYNRASRFAICYPFAKFLLETGEYNEVVLDAKAMPTGIFVFEDEYERRTEDFKCLAEKRKLPLVIFNPDSNSVTMLQPEDFK